MNFQRFLWDCLGSFALRWVRTGDEAIIDANNDIFIVDRLKEIMKVRGFQVAPAELEGHLLNNSLVSDVCVVGVPDEYSGEVPFAFVVPSAEASERINWGERKLVKAQIAKVWTRARGRGVSRAEGGDSDETCLYFLVCRGREGSIQALGWRSRVY